MISYLGSLVQFSPAARRAGHCRQISLCVGSARRVPATLGLPRTGVSVLSPSALLRLPAALYGAGPALSAVPVFGSSTKAQIRCACVLCFPRLSGSGSQRPGLHFPRVRRAFSLRREQPRQPEAWAPSILARCTFSLRGEQLRQPEACTHSPLARRAFPLRGPSARRWSGLRKSLDRNRGLCAGCGGVASLGLSLPLPPPPASFLQRGWGGSSLEFLSPFVLRTACGVFLLANFSALPQFKKSLPPTALRAFWPVLTLSNAAGSSPFRPHLLVVGAGVWGTFLLGVAFRHVICGPYLISPPS